MTKIGEVDSPARGKFNVLLDSNGNVVVRYVYDAWGNHAVLDANGADITDVNHIGVLNPFRYRGYYYDTETGLYFLKTRYYDPEVGRFITIDDISYIDPETINGLNLYAYCGNNPVMRVDENGNAWWEWLVAGLLVVACIVGAVVTGGAASLVGAALMGAAIGGGLSMVSQGINAVTTGSWDFNWGQFALDTGVGAITGAIGASGISMLGSAVIGGVIGGGSSIASDLMQGNSINWGKFISSVILCVVSGAVAGAGAKNFKAFQKSLNFDAGWNKAMSSMYNVTGKIAQGGYATVQGMKGALSIVSRNLSSAYALALKNYAFKAITKNLIVYGFFTFGNIGFSNIMGW